MGGFIILILFVAVLLLALCLTPWLKGDFIDRFIRGFIISIPVIVLVFLLGYFTVAVSPLL